MKIKSEYLILALIFILGILLRTTMFVNEIFVNIDGVSYMRLGKNLIESGRYFFGDNYNWGIFFPPGYPAAVGIFNLLADDLFTAAKSVSFFFGICTIGLFYLIGKELYNRESGLFAAFLFSIHPAMLEVSSKAATEAMFFFFMFFSIYLFMRIIKRSSITLYLLLGGSIAISYLTRPEGLFLLLLLLLLAVFSLFRNRKELFKLSIAVVVFILFVSPYLIFINDSLGRYALSGKAAYLPVLLEAEVRSTEVEYDIAAYSFNESNTHLNAFDVNKRASIAAYILKEPGKFFSGYISNLKRASNILLRLLVPVLLALLFSFVNIVLYREVDRLKLVLLVFALLYFSIYPSFFILGKLMYPSMLLLILIASCGFADSENVMAKVVNLIGMQDSKRVLFITGHIKHIIIVLCILGVIWGVSLHKQEYPVEHMKAGYYLKNNVSSEYEKLNVMHRVPWVSFYSDARYTMLPYAHTTDVVNFAKRYSVDFIVIDERSSIHEWEMYDELMNMNKYSDEVDLVYEDDSVKLIRMFKVKY